VAEVVVDGAQPSLVAAGGQDARAPGCQQRFRPPKDEANYHNSYLQAVFSLMLIGFLANQITPPNYSIKQPA